MAERITFVSHTAAPGGGELSLRRYLDRTSMPVELVSLEDGGVWDGMAAPLVKVSHAGLARALRAGQGPIVANTMRAALYCAVAKPSRRPLVYWVRDGLVDSAMPLSGRLATRLITRHRVQHYVANSAWTAVTVRKALKVAPSQVTVVPSMCGVTAPLAPRSAPRTPPRLLYLGRLARWKAPDVAVKGIRILRERGTEVTLTIAGAAHFGETTYARDLADLVREVGGVEMLGHVDDVPGLLAAHDLVVHCSTAPEPFGQVVVQSLSAGLPCLVTAHGGAPETVSGSPVGLTYVPGDPHSLADAVEAVLARYSSVSDWAVQRATMFDDHTAMEALNEFLTEMVN